MEIIWGILALCYSHPEMTMDFVKFAIAAALVYKLFSKHFKKVSTSIDAVTLGLSSLTKIVSDLATAMRDLETNHSARITRVEDVQKNLSENQSKLEIEVKKLTITTSQGGNE